MMRRYRKFPESGRSSYMPSGFSLPALVTAGNSEVSVLIEGTTLGIEFLMMLSIPLSREGQYLSLPAALRKDEVVPDASAGLCAGGEAIDALAKSISFRSAEKYGSGAGAGFAPHQDWVTLL